MSESSRVPFSMEAMAQKSQELRRDILELVYQSRKGHIGGCFSCIDVLTALYYGPFFQHDPKCPDWAGRDRFVFSKGHAALALYAVLSDQGYFSRETLFSFGKDGTILGAHPDRNVPGVEVNSGSLGNGLGIGLGMALADKLDGKENKTIVLTGDGECQEGAIWEAAMYASQQRLKNLIWVIDRNYQGVLDFTEDSNGLEPLVDRLKAFGWNVKTVDGHYFENISKTIGESFINEGSQPVVIIAETIKGKGVSFMEKKLEWHHKALNEGEYYRAKSELGGVS